MTDYIMRIKDTKFGKSIMGVKKDMFKKKKKKDFTEKIDTSKKANKVFKLI